MAPSSHEPAPATRRRSLGVQARAKETRRKLIRTAARLWSERGFDAVTVEEICSAAGVGRTTFYLHFESKEQLLSGLAAGTSAGVAADLDGTDASASLDDRLDVFVRGVTRRMQDVPKALAELVIHSQHIQLMRVPGAGAGITRTRTRFADLLREVLQDASDRGELTPDADPAELGEVLGALTMDAIEAWASGRSDPRPLPDVLCARIALVLDQFRP